MKSYYEVLNLEKTCSAKDIKDSYIELSKKYHPDINKSSQAHQKFVEVNEAYSVLGKTCSRVKYDQSLSHSASHPGVVYRRSPGQNWRNANEFSGNPYGYYSKQNYESTGNWRTSARGRAVLYCYLLVAFGTGVQLMVIFREFRRAETRSQEIASVLKGLKDKHHRLGREQVILELEKALVKHKNETKKQKDD